MSKYGLSAVFIERISKHGILVWTLLLTHCVTPHTVSNHQSFGLQDWEVYIIVLPYRVVWSTKRDCICQEPAYLDQSICENITSFKTVTTTTTTTSVH